jgi:predicted O-methyltransferase YrrM
MFSVSEEDGRFLRVLIGARGAKHVLEIGAARGYSAIWMGLALRDTGGSLVTIDSTRSRERGQSQRRARRPRDRRCGSSRRDAFARDSEGRGTFDLVFLDAWKPDYKRFFRLVFPRLDAGGVFVRTTSSTSATK